LYYTLIHIHMIILSSRLLGTIGRIAHDWQRSDTLESRAEPPPSRWIDMTQEQTYEYQNNCRGTRFTLLIMQGIRYEYKLIIAYMSDTVVYRLCKHISLEDNSICVLSKRGT
jgi:hypothetical protein